MNTTPGKRRHSRVPSGRFERLARIGWLAGELAFGSAAARLRGGEGSGAQNWFFTGDNARRFARQLAGMRGAAMKLGQLLSLEGEDVLPPEVAAALAVLRSEGDAMPPEQLRRVLGRSYGRGWQRRFREFEFDPVAAASIGQVHRAVTSDGRELALKVQYPGVDRSIASDVDNLALALRLARVLPVEIDLANLLEEAKRQLRNEADYLAEAAHFSRYLALLADEPAVVVPRVHADFSTAHVLAIDYLRGRPLEDLCGAEHAQERRDRAGELLLRLALRELFEFRFMQTDPNFANYLFLAETDQIGLLDLGAAREIGKQTAENYAALFRAALADDRAGLRRSALALGFVASHHVRRRVDDVVELLLLGTEPLRQAGIYDFGCSQVPARARAAGFETALRHGLVDPPPPEILLIQRKLGGVFLLCARLRARVDARALVEAALSHYGTPLSRGRSKTPRAPTST